MDAVSTLQKVAKEESHRVQGVSWDWLVRCWDFCWIDDRHKAAQTCVRGCGGGQILVIGGEGIR